MKPRLQQIQDEGRAIAATLPVRHTQREVAAKLGISAQAVDFQQNVALWKLAHRLRAKLRQEAIG